MKSSLSTPEERGSRTAFWLFAALVLMRALQSVVCLVDPSSVAASADGIPVDRYPPAAAQTVASLFALNSYGRLILCLLAALVLLRMRSLTPWLMWAFLVDQLGRRMLLRVYPFASVGAPPGNLVSWILIALNVLALVAYYFQTRPSSPAPSRGSLSVGGPPP